MKNIWIKKMQIYQNYMRVKKHNEYTNEWISQSKKNQITQ